MNLFRVSDSIHSSDYHRLLPLVNPLYRSKGIRLTAMQKYTLAWVNMSKTSQWKKELGNRRWSTHIRTDLEFRFD